MHDDQQTIRFDAPLPECRTLTVAEAAEVLGIGRSLAYEMARDGRLPTLALGARRYVIPLHELEAMLTRTAQS